MNEINKLDNFSPILALANCIRAQLRYAKDWEEADEAESTVKARAAANAIFVLD